MARVFDNYFMKKKQEKLEDNIQNKNDYYFRTHPFFLFNFLLFFFKCGFLFINNLEINSFAIY